MDTTYDLDDPWLQRQHPMHRRTREARSPFQVDLSRVIHSVSYRRLAGKSQILGIGDGHEHRTRQSHSHEVAQVANGLVTQLRYDNSDNDQILGLLPDRDMLEAICLVHDLGHPPFGHGGEDALQAALHDAGGFEGNGQTLRILTKLEEFHELGGSNFTRRTLLGTLKYPVAYSAVANNAPPATRSPISGELLLAPGNTPPKCYLDTERENVAWLLNPLSDADRLQVVTSRAKSFDCTIMDAADDISYGIHDLEDMINRRIVSQEMMREDIPGSHWDGFLAIIQVEYPDAFQADGRRPYDVFLDRLFARGKETKCWISRLVGYMVNSVIIRERPQFASSLYRHEVSLRTDSLALLQQLKRFIHHRVIQSANVQQLRFKGQTLIIQLFGRLAHDPKHLLPADVYAIYPKNGPTEAQLRVICDYIASMTDPGLINAYERLFNPRAGSVHDFL